VNLSQAQPIASLEELRLHLQFALGLELSTIPPYLCALYSIVEGENSEAVEAIEGVVIEEMLHLTQAANVLNAIGGAPTPRPGDGPNGGTTIPRYPTKVAFIDRIPEVHLLPFSRDAIDTFIAIEEPLEARRPATAVRADQYDSIGAFYEAIETGLRDLCSPEVFAEASVTRAGCQVPPHLYYGGAGGLIEVVDLDSALAALGQIVRQGEGVPVEVLRETAVQHLAPVSGAPGATDAPVIDQDVQMYGWRMYSHYARFKEIREGRHYRPDQLVGQAPAGDVLPVDWHAVLPMTPDPKAEDYDGEYGEAMAACNRTYSGLVDTLYRCFNGEPDLLEAAVFAMYDLKYQAIALMKVPSPLDPARTLGPAFEYQPVGGTRRVPGPAVAARPTTR
jgi:hypothetical protein